MSTGTVVAELQNILDEAADREKEIERLNNLLVEVNGLNKELKVKLQNLEIFEDILAETEDRKYGMVTIRNMVLYKKLMARSKQVYHNFDNRFLTSVVEACLQYGLNNGWSRVKNIIETKDG